MTSAQTIDYVVHGSTFNLAAFRPIADEIARLAVNDDPWRQCAEEFRRADDSIRLEATITSISLVLLEDGLAGHTIQTPNIYEAPRKFTDPYEPLMSVNEYAQLTLSRNDDAGMLRQWMLGISTLIHNAGHKIRCINMSSPCSPFGVRGMDLKPIHGDLIDQIAAIAPTAIQAEMDFGPGDHLIWIQPACALTGPGDDHFPGDHPVEALRAAAFVQAKLNEHKP